MHVSGKAKLAFFPVQPNPARKLNFVSLKMGTTHRCYNVNIYSHTYTLTANYNTCWIDQPVQRASKLVPSHVTSHAVLRGRWKVRLTDRWKTEEDCICKHQRPQLQQWWMLEKSRWKSVWRMIDGQSVEILISFLVIFEESLNRRMTCVLT